MTIVTLEPTRLARQYLRRFSNGLCPLLEGDKSYHTARVLIGIGPADQITGDVYPHDDPRWPMKCACGCPFGERDAWHLQNERLYTRSDTGEEVTLDEAPPHAVRRYFNKGEFQ